MILNAAITAVNADSANGYLSYRQDTTIYTWSLSPDVANQYGNVHLKSSIKFPTAA